MEEALTRIIQKIRTYDHFPENGLAIFAGETDQGFILKFIEPPKKVFTYRYQCSNELFLEPLQAMLASNDLIGIISIDSEEAGVGLIDGPNCFPIKTITSGVSGKSSKGGSSARRYERDREAKLNVFFHRIAILVNATFLPYGTRLKRMVISGPFPTKEKFYDRSYLDYRLKQLPTSFLNQEYAGSDGIRQTFNRMSRA